MSFFQSSSGGNTHTHTHTCFLGGSDSNESACLCGKPRFDPWVKKILWRREWQPTPVFMPGEFHGQRTLVGYSPWLHRELEMTEQLTLTFHFVCVCVCVCVCEHAHNCAWLSAILWTISHQAPLSMGFSRQEYWSVLPFPSPEDLLDPEIEPGSPTLQADSLLPDPPGKPYILLSLSCWLKYLERKQ